MRIPVSPGQQVQQQPMSGFVAQNTAVQAPSVAGAFGEASGQVSDVMQWADNLRTEDVFNQALAEAQKIKTEAGQQLGANVQPKDGKSFQDVYLKKFDDLLPKMEGGLTSSRQKVMLQRKVATLRQSLAGDLDAHAAKETKAYFVGINENTVTLEAENAKANMNNLAEITRGQMRVDASVRDNAKLMGWSPEETQVQRQKAMDQFHGGVIGAAIDAAEAKDASPSVRVKYIEYAKTYLENHANDMSADLKAKAQGVIQKKEGDLTVDVAVETIFKQLGPKNDKEAVSLDKMNAAIPENLTPEAKKAVRQGLQEMAHAHDYSVKQRENATVSDFYQSIEKGANWAQIKKTPAFDSLDGKVQDSLRKHYEQERGIVKGEGIPAGAPQLYWHMLEQPDRLKSMTVNDIFAMSSQLGKRYRDDLLERRDKLLKPGAGGSVKENVVNDAIKFFGLKGGYLVKNGDRVNPVAKDQTEWAEINYKINQRIAAEDAKTEPEITKIVRSTMAKAKIVTKGALFGTNITEKRVSSMSDQELDAVTVKIPPADLETIYAYFLRRGITGPTKRQILEAHAALRAED